ncbi:hypothetical protein JRQ81_003387 [Phrynocephalus forsythii]|uniref:Core Histone H2A/H2B/H3 domain-containing protein n=1 Tax=Phrynocephalus forsythii TaxID=171643 RepID=A0A9Q0XKP2_9SAUR|nr:hypothetical protein JRQ81_003387 [Phrynocephalus forsythii]
MHKPGAKPHRDYPARASVLKQSHRYQKKASGLSLNKLPILHFSKRLAHGIRKNLRFQPSAVLALQEACQAYLLELTEDWKMCAMHAKRVTVLNSDIHLARCLRGEMS